MSTKTARDILVEARALIAKPYGWGKGAFVRQRTIKGTEYVGYCAVGALRVAAGGEFDVVDEYVERPSTPRYVEAITALESEAHNSGKYNSGKYNNVMYYNDRKVTKKKDILDLYDRAIKKTSV